MALYGQRYYVAMSSVIIHTVLGNVVVWYYVAMLSYIQS